MRQGVKLKWWPRKRVDWTTLKIHKMKYECEWKKWLMSRQKKKTNERYPDWFSFLSGLKLACAENKKKNVVSQKLMKLLRFDESFWRACLQYFRKLKRKEWMMLAVGEEEQNNIVVIVKRTELDINGIFNNWNKLDSIEVKVICFGVKIEIGFFFWSLISDCDVNVLWVSHRKSIVLYGFKLIEQLIVFGLRYQFDIGIDLSF